MSHQETSQKVAALYNEVSYVAFGEDYFPVVKSLGLTAQEFSQFAKGKRALEVGCGGGQLTAFLARNFDHVTAIDISSSSLNIARQQNAKLGINNVEFLEANLFDDAFVSKYLESFDFILCYGVLHHTANPKEGYERLVKMLKVGGSLTVGVYSRTQILYRIKRKIVLWLAGDDWKKREHLANRLWFGGKGNRVSIFDGYVHPQVSFHSIVQVYEWAKNNRLSYISSWPLFELRWYWDKLLKRKIVTKNYRSWNYNGLAFFLVELVWVLIGKSVMVSMSVKKIKK